jgi:ribosome biogenesis GTPase / thiamine phosphate phosphatase
LRSAAIGVFADQIILVSFTEGDTAVDRFDLGWNSVLDQKCEEFSSEFLVRITERHKTAYRGITANGDYVNCYLAGRVMFGSASNADLPAVGDWCVVGNRFVDESNDEAAMISQLLPRYSKLSRMSAGTDSAEQVLAANVDFVFVVTSINRDFSINRVLRYVLLAKSGNSQPVIVLSKIDLSDEQPLAVAIGELAIRFPDSPCICVSALSGKGIHDLRSTLGVGQTAVFVGSSGVGKSTLVNEMLGRNLQKTTDVRSIDDKGRHTTSGSGLFLLDSGGMIIDTPGLREVAVLGEAETLDAMMPNVADLSSGCKFVDCSHRQEPGCAVLTALDEGILTKEQFASYARLEREIAFARRKLDQRAQSAERKKWKRIAIDNRRGKKLK